MGKKHSKLSNEELQELVATTHFSSKDLNKWYRGFLDDCPSGSLSKEEFCKIFHKFFPFGETSDFAKLVFNVLDSNENGVVSFKEFVISLSVTAAGSNDERLKWVFQLYDTDRDGYISRDEVEGVVSAMHRMLGHMTSLQEEEEEDKGETEEQETLQERVSSLWEIMDTDKVGRINADQFLSGCKRDPGTMKALALYERQL